MIKYIKKLLLKKVSKKICIIGSLRAFSDMTVVAIGETLKGHVVFMPINGKSHFSYYGGYSEEKGDVMTELHKKKIEMSDEVWVVTDITNYYGKHTREEINYALDLGKEVRTVTLRNYLQNKINDI